MRRKPLIAVVTSALALAFAAPASATSDPGGHSISGSKRCPAGKQVRIISFAHGIRIDHVWSRLGGGRVHRKVFSGGLGYEVRDNDTGLRAVYFTVYSYTDVTHTYPNGIQWVRAVCL